MPVVVVDEAELVVHVFAGEAEFVLFRHVAFRRDQTSVRPVFVQGAASARFPEEGGDVFHRVVHAVEMLFLLRPVHFPARHGQDARGLRFRGVPDVTAHNLRRFPGQVALRHLQVVTVEVARVEARCPSNRHFFLESPAHGVVGAFHGCPSVFAFKFHVGFRRCRCDFPDAGGCSDQTFLLLNSKQCGYQRRQKSLSKEYDLVSLFFSEEICFFNKNYGTFRNIRSFFSVRKST